MILDKLFSNKSKIQVLREICSSKEGVTNSQITKSTNLSKMSVSRIIKELVKNGVIKVSIIGRSVISTVNNENYTSQFLTNLFNWEKELGDGLIKVIEKSISQELINLNVLSLVLFGSRARGKNKLESDFDIIAIVDKGESRSKISYHQGFKVQLFVIPESEFINRLNKKDPLITNILIDGKVLRGKKEYERIIQKSKY